MLGKGKGEGREGGATSQHSAAAAAAAATTPALPRELTASTGFSSEDVLLELGFVLVKVGGCDQEGKVYAKEELELQRVELVGGQAADLGIVLVVKVHVVKEFGGQHDAGDNDTVDVEGG